MTHDLRCPKITTAMEIAILIKMLPDHEDCARLIEEYAQMVAAGAKLDATLEADARMDALMRNAMERRPDPIEYAETLIKVEEAMSCES